MSGVDHPSAQYDESAQLYADAFQDETLSMFPLDRNMIRLVVDLAGGRPRALDAGCGAGQVTKMMRNWGCDAVGVDTAARLVGLARAAYPDLEFAVGDLRALPYRDQDFDLVVARYSVIHTSPAEVPVVVGEFARVLRPGGGLLVEFQSSGTGPTRPLDHQVQPAWSWNPDEFAELARRAGLVERGRLVCPAQPDLTYARTPEAHLIFRRPGPWLGPEPNRTGAEQNRGRTEPGPNRTGAD
jgi:SAM-dependent methyltransferase